MLAQTQGAAGNQPIVGMMPQARKGGKPPVNLVSRQIHPENTVINVDEVLFGGPQFVVIAGPCAVESQDQLLATARAVRSSGAAVLRGGAYKPRTSPYSFQGLGVDGLDLLTLAKEKIGLPIITEVMDGTELALVEAHTDIIQVGARNIQNFSLLRQVGHSHKPVLLKRGLMTTLDEFLMSAEYILAAGNPQVILCERGIRTFETATRNTLDLSAVPILKERTHLPVIVDPSHAVGDCRYVCPLARAAMAVGADGLMVEVHISPETALCDGQQSLSPAVFQTLMDDLRLMAGLFHRVL